MSKSLIERFSFILGLLLAGLALHIHSNNTTTKTDYDQLALGSENEMSLGVIDEKSVHCQDMLDIQSCLDAYEPYRGIQNVTLWLGNSQLHAINQFKKGDKPSSALLHQDLQSEHQYLLTLSQPNANLQEHYVLMTYVLDKFPVNTLILPVVFDDMRETGIRFSISTALRDDESKATLSQTEIGKSILRIYSDQDSAGNDLSALKDTLQERSERFLNNTLKEFWSVWDKRESLRGELIVSLYLFRNWALGIHASSIRKMIPGRYATNLDAFKATLELSAARELNTLVYIVPVRNDINIPYSPTEYANFKKQIAGLCAEFNVSFINLEDLVPPGFWGTKDATNISGGQEVDFMHFQAHGHELLSYRLYEELTKLNKGINRP